MELCIHTSFCCSNQVLLFPLWASARLPLFLAAIAELGLASARHVVAAVVQLNQTFALVASLPALFNSQLIDQTLILVCGAETAVRGFFASSTG